MKEFTCGHKLRRRLTELGAIPSARGLGRDCRAVGHRAEGEQELGRGDQGSTRPVGRGRAVHPRARQAATEAAGRSVPPVLLPCLRWRTLESSYWLSLLAESANFLTDSVQSFHSYMFSTFPSYRLKRRNFRPHSRRRKPRSSRKKIRCFGPRWKSHR